MTYVAMDSLRSAMQRLDLQNEEELEKNRTRSGIFAYTIAGNVKSDEDENGSKADPLEQFVSPSYVCCDKNGNIFFSNFEYNSNLTHKIIKIAPDGKVSTLAGSTVGNRDGIGTEAQFCRPSGLCIDEEGTMYVANCNKKDNIHRIDNRNFKIRKVLPNG
ncbi:MAG: hypothetical protein JSR46_02510, partial [Verrucomicrobia bacterium]|nr:hypothetical protein [Verrucomicrobiota bacterium]